ncbi:MAG: cytochrome c oxidase assembly protein [Gemmatimonadales bacterium]|nr:cytochrome c oxidase assembly protein [Gemmatimonadales bacterium]MBA3555413.1 cytochrome c oxidase assembly protein [Gemmatimonadales bacterium]MDQ3427733.1 cytochrome c oxidase assembly protein [Gemmatimonadota bacterium]
MPPPLAPLLDERPRPVVPYEWSWSLHPSVFIGTGLLGALYFYGIGPLRRRWNLGPPAEPWQVASFSAGLLVLLVSLNGPMHDLSDYYLFSAHMVQHLLLTLLLPPLLIAGIPGWLLRPLLRNPGVLRAARMLTRPVVAALIYSLTIAVWHLAPYYDLMMRSHNVHIATHLMFMVAATIMWWPVMSPVPELPRLPYGVGMLYLFLVGIPMQVVAALITLSDQVLYPWYASAPPTWGLSPLDDQRLGGLLMWVPGNLWMFLAIGVLFFKWAKETE